MRGRVATSVACAFEIFSESVNLRLETIIVAILIGRVGNRTGSAAIMPAPRTYNLMFHFLGPNLKRRKVFTSGTGKIVSGKN